MTSVVQRRSLGTRQRLDLHNVNIDFELALRGLCGYTHLATGRVCELRYRHRGPCRLRSRGSTEDPSR